VDVDEDVEKKIGLDDDFAVEKDLLILLACVGRNDDF